jgi:aminopeptidase N
LEAGLQSKFQLIPGFAGLLMNIKNTENLKKGLVELASMGKQYKNYGADKYVNVMLNNLLKSKQNDLDKASIDDKANLQNQIQEIQKTIDDINKL